MLVVDSNNKVSKRAIDAITVDVSDFMSNGLDNKVVTATGTDAMNAEAYLEFQNDAGETDTSTLSLFSSQDVGDKFTIATTTHGATTLTTIDDDATAAHFEVAADGDIILDSAGQIKLEPVAGNNILLDGTIAVDAGVVTGATSITSTAFVGDVTGNTSGTAATVTGATQAAITTLAGVTSLGAAGATTDIAAGDLTMYNAVNDGNPTISLGSSATNRLEIKSVYNSGATSLCDIDFTTYTSSGSSNDGRFNWYVDEVHLAVLNDNSFITYGTILSIDDGAQFGATDTTASSATQGGRLFLAANDGAAMGDDHRLGVIEFRGAEDASSNFTIGARIEAMCDAAWSASENGARLDFYTTDANASESKVLTLDSDKLATFTGAVTVTGNITGTLATASQPNITTVGTIGTGVWNGTKVTDIYTNSSGKRFGNTIKILPTDFMVNDDVLTEPLTFKDAANSGVAISNTASEMIAFITIPEGMKATALDIYSSNAKTVNVYDVEVDDTFNFNTASTVGTGNANTQITLDVDATATNYLAIIYVATATTNRVYGGLLTIAAQ